MKLLFVFGTRPEAIKMCPLVLSFNCNKEFHTYICLTGQHKEMLDQVMKCFELKADYNLEIMKENQTLVDITSAVLTGVSKVVDEVMPDFVFVHGDTSTAFAAALSAFYKKIPIVHIEAGLRTGDIYSPYPEEMNRVLVDHLSTYYFAPTNNNAGNLRREGILDNIYVTGNTGIDSFKYTVKEDYVFHNERINQIDFSCKRVIIVTAHRRENQDGGIAEICEAIKELSVLYEDVQFVYPVHLSPKVRNVVFSLLDNLNAVLLVDPLDVIDMHNLLARSYMVMTDSGGLQEEAPYLNKPVIILRTETERPEVLQTGAAKIAGTSKKRIVDITRTILDNPNEYNRMAKADSPYGDGKACEKIVKAFIN